MSQRLRLVLSSAVLAALVTAVPAPVLGASPTRFDVVRTSSAFEARSDTGLVYSGTLKVVVEAAAADLDAAGGGRVQFGSGTYDLGSAFFLLHNLANVEFAGAGMDATVLRNNSSAAADTEPFNMESVSGLTIRDMTVIADGAARSTSDALDFDDGSNNQVLRIRISDSRARGIVFDGKGVGWHADGNQVRDCIIDGVPTDGIQLLAASQNTIAGCRITNTGRHGIQVVKASATAKTPNKPSNDNTLEGNTIDQAGADGINVTSSNGNRIRNNRVTNSADDVASRDGIRIGSSDSIACNDNVVEGNTATDTQSTKTQRYGLYISTSLCARTVVGANSFGGNLSSAIRDSGTGTIYTSDSQAPSVPTGLRATAVSETQVDLAWSGSSDNVGVAGYTVYRNGTPVQTLGASARTYSDTGLTPGTQYGYQVDAFDASGNRSAKSSTVSVTTPSGTGGGVTSRVVADTWVAEDLPTSSFATSTSLRLDASPVRRAYLRFEVQGLSSAPSRVVLRVYATSSSTAGFLVHGVSDDSWSESITWNAAPDVGAAAGSSGAFAAGTWVQVDVTGLVDGNGLHSLALTTTSSTSSAYASRESANDPELVITP